MWYQRDAKGLTLYIFIQPGSKKTEVVGIYDGELKIRLNAPPIEGRANKALIQFIALLFKVPLKQVFLTRGDKSRHKVLKIVGNAIVPDDLL